VNHHMVRAAAPLMLLAACGREDSIWTGVSGVVLFILIAWAAIHFIRK
jgi:hypothetical protein